MTNVLSRLGNNFLVAAFIPALGFVLAAQLIFAPLDPAGDSSRFLVPQTLEEGILTIVLALIAGFTMMGLMTFNYKLLEGYMILERIPSMRRRQYRKAQKRKLEYMALDKLGDSVFASYDSDIMRADSDTQEKLEAYEKLLERIEEKARSVKAAYKEDYPIQIKGSVLPTRFGNIFKSAEAYANENYGMDSVRLWPRLVHVIAPSYGNRLDASNNNLAFLVNCMAFSLLLALLCILASAYHLFAVDSTVFKLVDGGPLRYLVAAILFLGLSFFFYNASLPAARQYNNLVRSAFDLFRFDLLASLHVELPNDNSDEFALWTELSDFIAVSGLTPASATLNLQYTHSPSTSAAVHQIATDSDEDGHEAS